MAGIAAAFPYWLIRIFSAFLLLFCLKEELGIFDALSVRSFPIPQPHNVTITAMARSLHETSPESSPKPLLPLLGPSPMTPFLNNSLPKLSGKCSLNFSAVESLITTTAVDCFTSFAPFLANVICCPQLQATLIILMGLFVKERGVLSLDSAEANFCLSDFQNLLSSQGANDDLTSVCALHFSNLTEGSCPLNDVNMFESLVESSLLLDACQKVDPVHECCSQVCQNAITDAAQKVSFKGSSTMDRIVTQKSSKVDSCRIIVLRWLSSRLSIEYSKKMLRLISNCDVNKVCPLNFPDTSKVAEGCGGRINNASLCCKTVNRYVSHLQKQSFITNLQALDCAALLGMELQKMHVSENVYGLCHVTLKDFSLQVGSQESGCLLPSMPSDATLDPSSGISFTCDLNDNIAAPWPSSQVLPSSCNKSVNYPAFPAATSAQSGANQLDSRRTVLVSFFLALQVSILL